VGLSGWVGVELGGNCDCRCGILIPSFSHTFIVVFLTEFTSPYTLNTQRGWHTSEYIKQDAIITIR